MQWFVCRDSGVHYMDGSVGTDAELAHTPEILHIMNKISELIDESFPDTTNVASLGVYTIYCALLSLSVFYLLLNYLPSS